MTVKTISAQTLKEWIDNNQAVVIDVREASEYESKHIKGSYHIPVGEISSKKLPKTDRKIVIHCFGGKRGTTACQKILSEDDGAEIYNLEGGISAWENAGFNIESTGRKTLPIDRQVQITTGSLALVGTILGAYVNSSFLIIPAFIGAGLTFAGLTGTCTLAMLLAKMPWNKANAAGSSCSASKKAA